MTKIYTVSLISLPAGFRCLSPKLSSTAVLTRIPTVLFSSSRPRKLAVVGKGKEDLPPCLSGRWHLSKQLIEKSLWILWKYATALCSSMDSNLPATATHTPFHLDKHNGQWHVLWLSCLISHKDKIFYCLSYIHYIRQKATTSYTARKESHFYISPLFFYTSWRSIMQETSKGKAYTTDLQKWRVDCLPCVPYKPCHCWRMRKCYTKTKLKTEDGSPSTYVPGKGAWTCSLCYLGFADRSWHWRAPDLLPSLLQLLNEINRILSHIFQQAFHFPYTSVP